MDKTEFLCNLESEFSELKNKSKEDLKARLSELPFELDKIRNRPGMMEMLSDWPEYVVENEIEEIYIRYLLGEDITVQLKDFGIEDNTHAVV